MPANIEMLISTGRELQDEQLLELVKHDPGLCADLLHLANAFCTTSQGPIETVEQAVEDVGTQPLVQLISVWYARNAIAENCSFSKQLNDYFQHSQEISLSSRILIEISGREKQECETYSISGLIHDIGRLVILLASNQATVQLTGTPWDKMKSIVQDEKELLGMNHCDIGMEICRKWNFSEFMQELVLRHHTPLLGNDFSYPGAIVFLGHFVSYSDFTGETLACMLPMELLDAMKLTITDFERAQKEYSSRIKQIQQFK